MKETPSLVRLSYQAIKKKRRWLSPKAILLLMVLCYSCHGVFASPPQRERIYTASDFKRAAPRSDIKEVENVVNIKGAKTTGSEEMSDPDGDKKHADPVDETKGSESLGRIDGPDEDVDNVRTELVSRLKREVARVKRDGNETPTAEAIPTTVEPLEDAEVKESTPLHLASTEASTTKPTTPPPKPTPRPTTKASGLGIFRNCPTNGMECADKLCVHFHKWCDGVKDCKDGTDENPTVCEKYPCPIGFKKCSNNLHCVREERFCDGVCEDCPDNSDESAKFCTKEMFECRGKGGGLWSCREQDKCIPLHRVCDGVDNCRNSSDEWSEEWSDESSDVSSDEYVGLCEEWECLGGYQKCSDRRMCVPDEWICNGWYDCHDKSDEINCDNSMACRPGFRMCRDKTECIDRTDFCNERTDCSDDSDEEMCDRWTCFPGTLPCSDTKQCMPVEEFCNGKIGCNDGSDGDPSLCKPATGGPCPTGWKNCTAQPLPCFPASAECDGFEDCEGGEDEQDCIYKNRRYPFDYFWASVKCGPEFWACKDGKQCILLKELCDGEKNCEDGSDEDDWICASNIKCGREFWKCRTGKKCILLQELCDGQNNCEDGSDEDNRYRICEHRKCLPGLRSCLHRHQCLPDAWFCNTKYDCLDRSDEIFCDKKMSLERIEGSAASNLADLAWIMSITVIGYLLV